MGFCFFLTILFAAKVEDHIVDTAPAIRQVPTSQKIVALTFDDGPARITTPEILSILKEKNIKATFFVVGEQVKRFPSLVSQEIEEGHEVGNHTYSHPQLTRLNVSLINKELEDTEQEIIKFAPKPTLFRPPGGAYNKNILTLAREKGYTIILWSIDTYDWRNPPIGKIVDRVVDNIKPGSIILLHDGRQPSPTPEALTFIIDSLTSRGYSFVTVSELLKHYEPQ
jgi:polysaccharide deacetylase family sporulation protein PdaB